LEEKLVDELKEPLNTPEKLVDELGKPPNIPKNLALRIFQIHE
jgi:hypothetical protein